MTDPKRMSDASSDRTDEYAADPRELIPALQELLAAERAGARVAAESLRQATDPAQRQLLERIRAGEADSCRRLIACLEHLGTEPSREIGSFHAKAMAIDDIAQRLAFIDRGQRWVIRRVQSELPHCGDPRIRQELETVLRTHEVNSQSAPM